MKPKIWILLIIFILLIALAIIGYFSVKFVIDYRMHLNSRLQSQYTTFYIDIRDYGFMPENLTIKQGERIIWKNLGTQNHSVVFPKLNISSGNLTTGMNYSFVFNYTGNFTYGCVIHPDKLGMIFVE